MRFLTLLCAALLLCTIPAGADELHKDVTITGALTLGGITNKSAVRSDLGAGLAGKVVVVDSANGNDSTGARAHVDLPFLTPVAAKTAASSGDTIVVWPGAYSTTASLAKNGVNWWFAPGATVTMSASGVTAPVMFGDGGSALVFSVSGFGAFVWDCSAQSLTSSSGGGILAVSNASSDISFHAKSLSATGGKNSDTVLQTNGRLALECEALTVSNTVNGRQMNAIQWSNGDFKGRIGKLAASGTESAYVVWGTNDGSLTLTGAFWLEAEEIEGNDVSGAQNAIFSLTGSNSSQARWWIHASQIKAPYGPAIGVDGTTAYFDVEKIFGTVSCTTGKLYVTTQKIEPTKSGYGHINLFGGQSWIHVQDLEPGVSSGQPTIFCSGGTHTIAAGRYQASASSKGVTISGGTLELTGHLDTSANSSASPIVKSGGTLVLGAGTALVAEATQDSISAASAQNVKVMPGVAANKAVDADVTQLVSTITVSSDVQ